MSLLLALTAAGGSTYTITCDPAAFTVAAQDASLIRGRVVAADAAAYTVAAQDATLIRGRVVSADAATYVVDAQDATLVYTPGGAAYTITCGAAEYVWDVQDAELIFSGSGTVDTHDGYWHKQWLKLRKRQELPTIAEVARAVKENPAEAIAEVRAEVVAKYPDVDYEAVRRNVQLQRFIAKLIIDAAQREEDDIEILLLA